MNLGDSHQFQFASTSRDATPGRFAPSGEWRRSAADGFRRVRQQFAAVLGELTPEKRRQLQAKQATPFPPLSDRAAWLVVVGLAHQLRSDSRQSLRHRRRRRRGRTSKQSAPSMFAAPLPESRAAAMMQQQQQQQQQQHGAAGGMEVDSAGGDAISQQHDPEESEGAHDGDSGEDENNDDDDVYDPAAHNDDDDDDDDDEDEDDDGEEGEDHFGDETVDQRGAAATADAAFQHHVQTAMQQGVHAVAPAVGALLALDERTVEKLLRMHLRFVSSHGLRRSNSRWLFALLARFQPPASADLTADLRTMARFCMQRRRIIERQLLGARAAASSSSSSAGSALADERTRQLLAEAADAALLIEVVISVHGQYDLEYEMR